MNFAYRYRCEIGSKVPRPFNVSLLLAVARDYYYIRSEIRKNPEKSHPCIIYFTGVMKIKFDAIGQGELFVPEVDIQNKIH